MNEAEMSLYSILTLILFLCFSNKRKSLELQNDTIKKLRSAKLLGHASADGETEERTAEAPAAIESTPPTSQTLDSRPPGPEPRPSTEEQTQAQAPGQSRPLLSNTPNNGSGVWSHTPMVPPGSHASASAQTVVVPPLGHAGWQKVGSLGKEELDRSILTQRLGHLEREAKRLRRKLGLCTSVTDAAEAAQAAANGGQPEGQPQQQQQGLTVPSDALLSGQIDTESKAVPPAESACASLDTTLDTQSTVPTIDLTTTGQMLLEQLNTAKQTQETKVQVWSMWQATRV